MKSNKKQDDEIFDKIKVFSSEDEKLKILGELLSNKSSRDIIKILIEKEMYTSEIAKKLELRISLVIHHLNKMESIGLLEITNKKIIRKGEEHRFFRMSSGMLIIPNESKDMINNGFFKRIFKSSVKFVVIGIVSIVSYVLTQPPHSDELYFASGDEINLTWPLLVIIFGLIIERMITKIKKEKKWINLE